jgi:hypothetical protein
MRRIEGPAHIPSLLPERIPKTKRTAEIPKHMLADSLPM